MRAVSGSNRTGLGRRLADLIERGCMGNLAPADLRERGSVGWGGEGGGI